MQRGFLGYRVSPDAMIRFSYMNLAAITALYDLEIAKRLDLAPETTGEPPPWDTAWSLGLRSTVDLSLGGSWQMGPRTSFS